MKLTPGAEAWVRHQPKIIEVADAKALEEMGLVTIDLIRIEAIALNHPRKQAHVTPTELAIELGRKL